MKSDTQVIISPIFGTSDELLAQLSQKEWYLPMLEKMSEHRCREWLSVRVVLKNTLGEEKEICYTDLGKPYLADNSYFISISHTKGYVAIALNKNQQVGVDIEYISPRVEKIRSRFMREEEEKHLSTKNPVVHLLLHWSAKETLFKLLDDIQVDFQKHLLIAPFEPVLNEWAEFSASESFTKEKKTFTIRYRVTNDYVITYATLNAISSTL